MGGNTIKGRFGSPYLGTEDWYLYPMNITHLVNFHKTSLIPQHRVHWFACRLGYSLSNLSLESKLDLL